jgi:hypothetical protein
MQLRTNFPTIRYRGRKFRVGKMLFRFVERREVARR